MNILRQSFIMALMKDPDLKSKTSYKELFLLVDEHFIQGIKENLTEKEEVIKKSNIFFYKLNNTQYCSLTTIGFTLKMQSVYEVAIFGIEKYFLKSLYSKKMTKFVESPHL